MDSVSCVSYRRAVQLEVAIEGWPLPPTPPPTPGGGWEALALRVAQAVAAVEPALALARLEASVLFTSDAAVHALNREWRGRDKPTNVLSFPMLDRAELLALAADGEGESEGGGPPVMLGDIALAYETCAREAGEKGIALDHHAAHLIVHGLLHLAGHDHVESDAQAEEMEAIETAILAKLGIADPYEP